MPSRPTAARLVLLAAALTSAATTTSGGEKHADILLPTHEHFPTLRRPPVMAFYYLWYGTPDVDGAYKHWDHEVLPHWDPEMNAREFIGSKKPGEKHAPPFNLHSPFYPARGCYSSMDDATLDAHVAEALNAGINTLGGDGRAAPRDEHVRATRALATVNPDSTRKPVRVVSHQWETSRPVRPSLRWCLGGGGRTSTGPRTRRG